MIHLFQCMLFYVNKEIDFKEKYNGVVKKKQIPKPGKTTPQVTKDKQYPYYESIHKISRCIISG